MAARRRLREAVSKTGPDSPRARARKAAARAARPSVLVVNVLDLLGLSAVFCANCADVNRVGQGVLSSTSDTRPRKSGGGVQPMSAAQRTATAITRGTGCKICGVWRRIGALSWRITSSRPYLGREGGAMRASANMRAKSGVKTPLGRFSLSVIACAR